jgi:hypothetical protein
MKTQTKCDRKINSVTTSRWTAYMAAAAASTFAGVGSAEAEIHYSGNVSTKLTLNARATLPLSNGASLAFRNFYGSYFYQKFHFVMKGVISASARGYFSSPRFDRAFLAKLGSGENVSAGEFLSVAQNPFYGVLFSEISDGSFAPDARGFVGFRFNIGNGTQYGWVRIETKLDNQGRVRDTIRDYAWGDVGDAILTGQTQSLQPANANSIGGSLGLLAFGAQGLDAWRLQRTPLSD